MNLDKIDEKILYELIKDARQPFKHIAKKVHVSKSTVQYRIKKLEDEEIITSYKTLINYSQLGIIYGRIQFKIKDIDSKRYSTIIEQLSKIQEIEWLASTQGVADIALVILCESIAQYAHAVDSIQHILGKWVQSQEVSLAHRIHYCAPNIAFSKKFIEPITSYFDGKQNTLKTFDNQLLSHMRNNGTTSLFTLAKKLNCSTKKLLAHKKYLEREKIIQRYTTEIDTGKLGFDTYHIFWQLNDFTPQKTERFKAYLLRMKETLYVTQALSHSNIESEFLVRNQRSLYELIAKIKREFPNLIKTYDYMLIYKIHKHHAAL